MMQIHFKLLKCLCIILILILLCSGDFSGFNSSTVCSFLTKEFMKLTEIFIFIYFIFFIKGYYLLNH